MKKTLYLGLTPPSDSEQVFMTHCPIIRIIPRNPDEHAIREAYEEIDAYTHYIFTSKNSVRLFFQYLTLYGYASSALKGKTIVSVGRATTFHLQNEGVHPTVTAQIETAEGIVQELEKLPLDNAYVLWPHSALARPVLTKALKAMQVKHREPILYDTLPLVPERKPNLDHYDEILFTSPSTVDAFFEIFGLPPKHMILSTIGPVTKKYLDRKLLKRQLFPLKII